MVGGAGFFRTLSPRTLPVCLPASNLIASLAGSNFVFAVQSVQGKITGWGKNSEKTEPGNTLKVIFFFLKIINLTLSLLDVK